jgi:DNA polymerase-3 subunit gamma/tau
MRDALSLLDQAISHSNGKITSQHVIEMLGIVPQKQLINILLSLAEGNPQALIEQCHEMGMQGLDFTHVLDELLSALQRIASLQLIDNLQVSDWDDSEELKQIASSLLPEMTQLYYQIALHGKRDLPYAANPQSGFEMTLLRMLSFRPSEQNISSATVVAVKKPDDTPPPAPPPQPKPEQIKQPAKTVAPKPREKKASLKQTTETELNNENWLTIINGLKLTALARQFADNCAFIEYQNQQITLTIAPELAHLASVKNQERLTASISQYLGQDVKLRLEDTNSQQSTTTAASKRAEQAEIAQQRANDSIHNDRTVDALKEAFGARIIESTIKPINLEE